MKEYLICPQSEVLYTEDQRRSYYVENGKLLSRLSYLEKRVQPEIRMNLSNCPDIYDGYIAQGQYKWSANISHLMYDVLSDHFVIRELTGARSVICRPMGVINQVVDFLGSKLINGEFPGSDQSCVPDPLSMYSYLQIGNWRHGGHKHSYISSIINRSFSKLMVNDPSFPKNIVINRRLTQGHPLRNRNIYDLEFFLLKLKSLGLSFEVVELEDMPINLQIKYFYNAEKILSIHGSGLVWLNFCRKSTKVIEVLPPWFLKDGYLKHDFWVIGNNAELDYKSLYIDNLIGDSSNPYDHDVVLDCNVIFELFK